MGIVYNITCDRCAEEYPAEIDSEMHYGSFFGAHPDDAALEVKENDWLITLENEVLCPACGADADVDSGGADDGKEERLKEAAYKLPSGEVVTGRTHAEAWGKVPGAYGILPYKSMSEDEAVEELIKDCETHRHIDKGILSTPAGYYEFLFTEVKFHADSWGVEFEKARQAYAFWAREYHSVEYE